MTRTPVFQDTRWELPRTAPRVLGDPYSSITSHPYRPLSPKPGDTATLRLIERVRTQARRVPIRDAIASLHSSSCARCMLVFGKDNPAAGCGGCIFCQSLHLRSHLSYQRLPLKKYATQRLGSSSKL